MWYVVGVRPGGDRLVLAECRTEALAVRRLAAFAGLEGYERVLVEECGMGAEPRGSLRLRDAEKRVPPVNAAEALRRQLQVALFGAIGQADVIDVVAVLKKKALAGDLQAMKILLGLIGQPGQPQNVQQVAVVGREPEAPTPALPGTEEKILVMRARAEAGQNVTHPDDGRRDEG